MAKVEYFGKFRARVHDINDPEKRGRIRVLCPKVLGDSVSNWCEPCVSVAYDYGGDFAVPQVGETVWVEFESGNINNPIYTGGWWATNSAPDENYNTDVRYIGWNDCTLVMSSGRSISKSSIDLIVGNEILKN